MENNFDEQAISSLMEMGIERDVAIDALNKANGDKETAVNIIFSGEIPSNEDTNLAHETDWQSQQRPLSQVSQYQDKNLDGVVTNEVELTERDDLGNHYDTFHHEVKQSVEFDDDSDDDEDEDDYVQVENAISDSLSLPSYQIVKASEQKIKLSDPTIMLPSPPNWLIENYFALFSWIVAKYLPLSIFKQDFKDLDYDPNWFRGTSLELAKFGIKIKENEIDEESIATELIPIDQVDEETTQPAFFWQLQKLASIINSPISQRSYVCSKMLSQVLDQQIQIKLGDVEHLHEVLPLFIKWLISTIELCPKYHDNEINQLLISSAFYKPDENEDSIKTFLSLFHFLPEEYDTNLYKMFNVLLNPEEDEEETMDDSNSLSEVSPMMTIVFDEIDESSRLSSLPDGVEMPLEFYPDLYTKSCKDKLIKHIINKRTDASSRLRDLMLELNSLKSFQGKDVTKFINSSLAYLHEDDKAEDLINALEHIKSKLKEKKTGKTNEYKDLAQKLHSEWNLSNPEAHIIGTAKKLGLLKEPHMLVLAVLSPYCYYIKERNGDWYFVQCNTSGGDFDVRKCSSELEIQDTIRQGTRNASETPLMFVYHRKDSIPNNEEVQLALEKNEGCSNFAKKDQQTLNVFESQQDSN